MVDDYKEQKELLNSMEELITKTFDNTFKSKTFICSIYLLKYIDDNNEKYFNKFISMFKDFTPKEQIQVMSNVYANLVEQGKLNKSERELKKIK